MNFYLNRLEIIRKQANNHRLSGIILSNPASLAWLFSARFNITNSLETTCFQAYIPADTTKKIVIYTDKIEALRLQETELSDYDLDWVVNNWYEESHLTRILPNQNIGSDINLAGCASLANEIAKVICEYDADHIAKLKTVSTQSAECFSLASHKIMRGMTEYEIAGIVSNELLNKGLEPVCLLVGADERSRTHRHSLPTHKQANSKVMIVACARYKGMITNITRYISWEDLSPQDSRNYEALLRVEQVFLDESKDGNKLSDVLKAGTLAYTAEGFAPDEWKNHHQGGTTGTIARIEVATPNSDHVLTTNNIVAWNPSAEGWKVEDTCLIGDDGAEVLVLDDYWPSIEIGGRTRPLPLILK